MTLMDKHISFLLLCDSYRRNNPTNSSKQQKLELFLTFRQNPGYIHSHEENVVFALSVMFMDQYIDFLPILYFNKHKKDFIFLKQRYLI